MCVCGCMCSYRLYDEHTLSDALPCGAIKHVAMLGRDLCKVLLIEDNLQVRAAAFLTLLNMQPQGSRKWACN